MKSFMKTFGIISILSVFLLLGCGGGGSNSASSGTTGTLSLSMIDASDESYKAVYVTVKEVAVCQETEDEDPEWRTVATLNKTYNLLTLVHGVTAALGESELEAGTYNQMRLILGNQPDNTTNILGNIHPQSMPQYLIDGNNVVHELKVPSGYNSGIKLVHPFEIEDGKTTDLILDFDVTRSIHLAGKIEKNGKYILRPTIKIIGTYNRAIVTGMVFNAAYLDQPLPSATVTAWPMGDASLSVSSTQTNQDGEYTLYLGLGENPGQTQDYTLVSTLNRFAPDCEPLTVAADQTYPDTDFGLSNADMVTISGTVTGHIDASALPEGVDAPSIHISFVQDCLTLPVEVAFIDTTDDANNATTDIFYNSNNGDFQYEYEISVPSGTYDVVASSEGLGNEEISDFNATVSPAALDISF
ncbi:MAG: DUF4382 domain-containing protein [Proteobacteria bacterium]|nr:DUF4382 domain-containing protein [Pseudomonadota bacterium]MBU4472330.1 DUF4382 domain-containing protein [Pseudomonadota bacterium]MCG2752026.1 DUF4382 domain-containing protein [Desulfobacteraceae bacterium]